MSKAYITQLKVLIFFSIIFLSLSGCDSKKAFSEADAQNIAGKKIIEYAERNKIPIAQIAKPEIRFNQEMDLWEFYYQSTGNPKHHVNILVDTSGKAETNFTIDSK